jgi:AraC-like DNA-binding protein
LTIVHLGLYSRFVQSDEPQKKLGWETLAQRLEKSASGRRYAPDVLTLGGKETRTQAERYDWEGMRRGADPAHPFVLFQVTLRGLGIYEDRRSGTQRLTVGRAFAAVIPSSHRYYLPEESSEWTFFWLILRHPYVARRIAERQQSMGGMASVLDLQPEDRFTEQMVFLLTESFADSFAEEAATFQLLMEYERHVQSGLDTEGPFSVSRNALLDTLRDLVLRDLTTPISVEAAANREGMSRTRYSHYFKASTGISPAAFMVQVRLEEVARRLAQTDATLTTLAAETGFADANHLCKAFRRHYHLSPGTFRKQMR